MPGVFVLDLDSLPLASGAEGLESFSLSNSCSSWAEAESDLDFLVSDEKRTFLRASWKRKHKNDELMNIIVYLCHRERRFHQAVMTKWGSEDDFCLDLFL